MGKRKTTNKLSQQTTLDDFVRRPSQTMFQVPPQMLQQAQLILQLGAQQGMVQQMPTPMQSIFPMAPGQLPNIQMLQGPAGNAALQQFAAAMGVGAQGSTNQPNLTQTQPATGVAPGQQVSVLATPMPHQPNSARPTFADDNRRISTTYKALGMAGL